MEMKSADDVVSIFDHALLHPQMTDEQLEAQATAMRAYPLASICIKPYAVGPCVRWLEGTDIKVGTVIGFPHGSNLPEVKALEAKRAFEHGATDVDMVVNVGRVLSGDWGSVRDDIKAVTDVTREHSGVIKVIFETDFITEDAHKQKLCEICGELGVDFVKTSTGFGYVKRADGSVGYDGATDHDIELMRKHSPDSVGVKPSGAVRSLARVLRLVSLGATRIGTSSTEPIYREAQLHFGEAGGAKNAGDAKPADGY